MRLLVAILYRARLDTLDNDCAMADEAQDYLQSDFAMLAFEVLLSEAMKGATWGNSTEYLGQIQRVAKRKAATNRAAARLTDFMDEPDPQACE